LLGLILLEVIAQVSWFVWFAYENRLFENCIHWNILPHALLFDYTFFIRTIL